jgi:hypothetical protein
MAVRKALSLLDQYESLKLDKSLFKNKLHHFGGGFESFYHWASEKQSFRRLECNQLLQDRLEYIIGEIKKGTAHDPKSLEKLIEDSWIAVPCSRYPKCQGHKFDPNCQHRK